MIIFKFIESFQKLGNFIIPAILVFRIPGIISFFIILALESVMFFHNRFIDLIHVTSNSPLIKPVLLQQLIQFSCVYFRDIEMPLLVGKDIIVFDPSP